MATHEGGRSAVLQRWRVLVAEEGSIRKPTEERQGYIAECLEGDG